MSQEKTLKKFVELVPRNERRGASMTYRGRSFLDFSCWDVFNLSENERFLHDASGSMKSFGLTAGASRFLSGSLDIHEKCESRFARFFGTEGALLFPTRNQLVLTLVTTLSTGALLLCDELSESPVIDSGVVGGAQVCLFQQNDVASLVSELERSLVFADKIVFLEGIQGFTGEALDYSKFDTVISRFGVQICIDETLALGISGLRGAGSADGSHPLPASVCRYASFDRHLGIPGAILTGPHSLIDAVLERSKNYRVEVSYPPFLAATAIAALDTVELASKSRIRISMLAHRLFSGVIDIGLVSQSFNSGSIVCIKFSSKMEAREIAEGLRAQSIFPDEHSAFVGGKEVFGIRFIVRTCHTEADVDRCLVALAEVRRRFVDLGV